MIKPRAVALGVSALTACTPVTPAFVAMETELEVGGMMGAVAFSQSLPAIAVRRGDGSALTRDDWHAAEAAASDHCAALGATYDPLPPARDYTQIRLEDGVFYFMARCLR
jgi:hypothetical protein